MLTASLSPAPPSPVRAPVLPTNANWSYSSQVTSVLPIQNGFSVTSTCGPSSASRPASLAGLPIVKVPPGTATISNETVVPGMVSV